MATVTAPSDEARRPRRPGPAAGADVGTGPRASSGSAGAWSLRRWW